MTTPDTLEAVFAELDDAIAGRLDLTVGWNILRRLKEAGASQDEVDAKLTAKLENEPDRFDEIADLMDFVSGWCSPGKQIWP